MQKTGLDLLEEVLFSYHFLVAMILGWVGFDRYVYSLTYFAKSTGPELAARLPYYALTVVAFGTLVYVSTRPVVIIGMEIIRGINRIITRFFERGQDSSLP